MPVDKRPKSPWAKEKSIFAPYVEDYDELLMKCFEFDFSCSRIPKLFKDPVELHKAKEYLREIYKYIRECYKFHSGVSYLNGVPCISQNVLAEIANAMRIADGRLLKLSDVDMEFIAVNARRKVDPNKKFLNPERGLVRYEFMEVLVRIAIQKYRSVEKRPFEAIKMFFEEGVLSYIRTFDCHSWRRAFLWNEACDQILTTYNPILQAVFKRVTDRKSKINKFISLEEFTTLMMHAATTKGSL